jgi:hypothetical protein
MSHLSSCSIIQATLAVKSDPLVADSLLVFKLGPQGAVGVPCSFCNSGTRLQHAREFGPEEET